MINDTDRLDTGPGARREALRQRPDYPRLVLIVALFGAAAGSYPVTVLSASLPTIAESLGTSDNTITWVIAAPLLAFALATPIAGKMGDLHGHRRIYLSGFMTGCVLSYATALAWDVTSLIVLRTLAQTAIAVSGPSAMAMILSIYPKRDRPRALGIWAAVVALSPAIGVVSGGPLIEWVGWRALFVVQGTTVVIALVAAIQIVPETRSRPDTRFDIPGSVLLGASTASLLIAINRGLNSGWDSPLVLICLAVSPIALIAFVGVERRVANPLIAPRLLRRRTFILPMAAQAVLQSGYMGAMVMAPFLLERRWGFRPTIIGLLMLPRPLAFAFSARIGGIHDPRHGARRVVMTGMFTFAAAMVLAGIGAQQRWLPVFILGAAVAGAGSGYIRPAVANSVTLAAGDDDLGIAGGSLNMLQQIGAAVGITVLTSLMGDSVSGTRFLMLHLLAAALAIVAAGLASRMDGTRLQE
ncbi:MAG: MFS transporter [Acidimicrobiales bacterium]|nr:MFS transporter [Acidimicrobiales bacterium]